MKPVKSKTAKTQSPSERLEAIGIESICEYVASGESLRSWCIKNKLNQRTVLDWIEADKDRSAHYTRAREEREEQVFESLDDVSDRATTAETNVEVAGLRLKSDNIKWKLARMNPKKYGDRQILSGDPDAPLGGAKIDLSKLTDAELQSYLALQRKLEGQGK